MSKNYKKWFVVFAAIIIAVVILKFFFLDSSNASEANTSSEDTTEIVAVPDEALINSEDEFHGGDLNLLFVHGKVKQIVESTSQWEGSTTYNFNEEGILVDYPNYPDIERNSEGRIVRVSCPDEWGEITEEFRYDSKGRLVYRLHLDTSAGYEKYVDFSDSGLPQSGYWGGEESSDFPMSFSYSKFDEHGNWTEMNVTKEDNGPTNKYSVWRTIKYYE